MESSFDSEFRQMVQKAPMPQKEPSKNWLKIAIIATGILLVVVAIVIVILSLKKSETGEPETVELGSITDIKETLNDNYAQAVSGTPHADYQTGRPETTFSTYSVLSVCQQLQVTCNQLATPTKLASFKRTEALNANALDYYLDHNGIIVMMAVYSYSDSTTPYPYVIYARTNGLYYVFDPNSKYMTYMARSELLDEIIGVPEFYVHEGSANGN